MAAVYVLASDNTRNSLRKPTSLPAMMGILRISITAGGKPEVAKWAN